jgi:predicted RNA-binding protein with PUA-like domain
MNYWLVKTEPTEYSFSDLQRDRITMWNGVSNPLALKYLRLMKKGDRVLVYHTGNEKAIIGTAEVADHHLRNPSRSGVTMPEVSLKAVKPLSKPVLLSELKSKKQFSSFELVRIPRLSVMPVTAEHWKLLTAMGNE